MTRYAALLRGINVGKHKRATSAQLCDAYRAVGFDDVATFRTSGNVVFSTATRGEAKVRALAESAMRDQLGLDVTVFLRSAAELAALVHGYPYPATAADSGRGKPQVVFLLERPSAALARDLLALATDDDRLELIGRDVCWWPKGSILDTAMDWTTIAKRVGPTTTRTFGTVEQLLAKHLTS